MPPLHFGERLAEARHASQANPVRDFPVTLPRLVVGHALTLEQLRRTRIHTGGNGSFVLPGHSVAYRAMLAVDLCPCSQLRLVAFVLGGGMVAARVGVVLRRSSSRFIDHLCPDAFGLENELDGFTDCAMPGEVLGNVVRGFFNFGDSIAYGNGEADTAH